MDTCEYLLQWVYTSEAPTPLVDLFDELAAGPGTNGTLAAAVGQAMGQEPLLYVLCTGQGAGMPCSFLPLLLPQTAAGWSYFRLFTSFPAMKEQAFPFTFLMELLPCTVNAKG